MSMNKNDLPRYFLMRLGNLTFEYSINPVDPMCSLYYWWVPAGLKVYGPFESLDKASEHYQFMFRISKQEILLDKQAKGAIIEEMPPDNAIYVDFVTKKKVIK